MMKNIFALKKFIAFLLPVLLVSAPCMASDQTQRMERARQRQERDAKELTRRLGCSPEVLVMRTAVALIGAVTSIGIGKYIYTYIQDNKNPMAGLKDMLDLRVAMEKVSRELRPGDFYAASKLGEENIRLLNQRLDHLKDVHVWSFPRKMEGAGKIFYVKTGMEEEFLAAVAPKYYRFLDETVITAQTRLPVGLNSLDIAYMEKLDQRFIEEVLVPEFRNNRAAWSALVERGGSKPGSAGVISAAKKLPSAPAGKLGRWLMRSGKGYALGLAAMLWIGGEVSAAQHEQDLLQRVEDNPALLLNVTDEQFAYITASPALSDYYLAVSEFLHAMVQLSDAQLQIVAQEGLAAQERRNARAALSDALKDAAR